MKDNIYDVVERFLNENYTDLIVSKRNKFVGCKFGKSDRFYIFYLSYFYGKLTITYRENINEYKIHRIKVAEDNVDDILSKIIKIVNESIINKPDKIISKNRKRIDRKKKEKYKYYIDIYKGIKLYELNLPPYVYSYCISKGIITVVDLILYDFNFSEGEELIEIKINNLKIILFSSNYFNIPNYKFLLKSSFKDNFNNDDYERYIDFSLCIGNLTFNFISKLYDERNTLIFCEYMNLTSKNNYTLRELGEKYEISFGRIRDIVKKQIKKLKKYQEYYLIIFNDIQEKDILNYFIVGIIGVYNRNFLKAILSILELDDMYDSIYYRAKFFVQDVVNKKSKSPVSVNESKMFNLVKFSLNVHKSNTLFFRSLCKMRSVNNFSDFTGELKLKKSKELVQYESLTEKRVLYMLDSCDFVKKIKTQSLVIPFQNFKENFEYYPDIQILTNDNKLLIIEVKPLLYMMERASIFKYNLLKNYAYEYNYAYAFIDDRYNSFDDILNRDVDESLSINFINYVKEKKYVNYYDYKEFKKINNCVLADIVSIVINNSGIIDFTAKPFKFRYKKSKVFDI